MFVGTALVDAYSKTGAITYSENVFAQTPDLSFLFSIKLKIKIPYVETTSF